MRSLFIIIIALFFSLSVCSAGAMKRVCFSDVCVEAQVSETDAQRNLGLMFRDYLPAQEGMLFIFPAEDKYSFWMKNMKFSLDMIWIDSNKKIVDIKTDIPPCLDLCENYTPGFKAMYVLEVNAGFVKKYSIGVGDTVSMQ
jgi:uncharacterized membrane protein (UPF0127 family)